MNKYIYAFGLIVLGLAGKSQQTPVVEHYLTNPYFINPAGAGANGNNAFLDYNKQWQGFQGAPETQMFSLDGNIRREKIGLGITILNQQTNIIGSVSGLVSYAYKAEISKSQNVRLGVSGGFMQNRILYDNIIAEDQTEAQIFYNNQNAAGFDVNGGLIYQFKDFQIGFAANHLLPTKFNYENNFTSNNLTYANVRHFLIHTNYDFDLKGGKWMVQPSLLVKGVQGIPFLIEGAVTGEYKKQVWLTARYKHDVGYTGAVGGVLAKQLVVAYAYTYSSKRIATQSSGTHEVLLGYRFQKQKGGSGDASNEDVVKLQQQNAELYEKVDYLSEENKKIREELEEQKKLLKERVYGLEELKKALEEEQEERDKVIEENEFDADAPLDSENNPIKRIEDGNLYVVVGATRKIDQAKKHQKLLNREYDMKTKIIRNNNDTWFFVYTLQTKDVKEAQAELSKVKKMNSKDLYVGKPWVYKH